MPCLILMAKGESWKARLKSSLPADFPAANLLEIHCTENGSFRCSGPVPVDHNGDAWVFAHGTNRSGPNAILIDKNFAIFGQFNSTTHSGILFDNKQFAAFINSAGIKRLYVFACYQGAYVRSMVLDIASLEHAEGLLGPGFGAAGAEFLKACFKDPKRAKILEVSAESGVVRAECAGSIASYAAAVASMR